MERRNSPTADAPEAVPAPARATFGFIGSDDYEYYEPPPSSAFERQLSPAPEYQHSETSPRVSAQSPPPLGSDIGRSPQLSDSGYSKSRPLSTSAQYSEIHSPDPQLVREDPQGEKEAVYHPSERYSKAPSYYAGAGPLPGIQHQDSGDKPQVWSHTQHDPHGVSEQRQNKKPWYRRWPFILAIIALIVIIAVAVPVGVVFGTKKKNHNRDTTDYGTATGADINISVGGQINSTYFSKAGAFNGSGIAVAAANTDENQAIYAFYQDHTGLLQYTLYDGSGAWNPIGPVNADPAPKARNGTPISAVQHNLGDEIRWHLFYLDENLYLTERWFSNATRSGPAAVWKDGSLNDLKLQAWDSNTVGMQACYWGNFFGQWSYGPTAEAGIHLWYAEDATTFAQYDWTNGTGAWVKNNDRAWENLSGHAGVGCQTWYGMTEYVWFVDTENQIDMYWRDNNNSVTSTSDHPVGEWTPVDIKIGDVQIDSSLGYTNYMMWQGTDATIQGAGIVWEAENTRINNTESGEADQFILSSGGKNVPAVRGTHLSITGVTTSSQGQQLQIFFQEEGDDVVMYTRDAAELGGLWQPAAQDPVAPPSDS